MKRTAGESNRIPWSGSKFEHVLKPAKPYAGFSHVESHLPSTHGGDQLTPSTQGMIEKTAGTVRIV